MSSLVIVGAQWGDEGKGKVTDFLTDKADVVVRYQGGNNAGHTVISNGKVYKLHLVPSGIVQNKPSVIGSGVALDPLSLIEEMNELKMQGIIFDKLLIDKRTHLILPYHIKLDQLREESSARTEIGTTKRGIGPCYEDKTKRCGIRVCDLMMPEIFKEKLKQNLNNVNTELKKIYSSDELDFDDIADKYLNAAKIIRPYVADTSIIVQDYIKSGKKVLFEGAQGTMLDVNYGTYPYVTSSHPTTAGVCVGAGIPPTAINEAIGIAKAYTTRVGKGPFPTELLDKTGDYLREKGHEYGVTTGRPRRCGWFDTVGVRYAARINGLTGLAITKLDTLTGLKEIKLCVSYKYKGEILNVIPPELNIFDECEPVYEVFEGWEQDMSSVRSYNDLNDNAKKYLSRISELCETPISIISVGPDRQQTIINGKFFNE